MGKGRIIAAAALTAAIVAPAVQVAADIPHYRYKMAPDTRFDRDPDPFEFGPVGAGSPGVPNVSSPVVVDGFQQGPISIRGGEYSLDGGPFTSAAGTVRRGQSVRVRVDPGPPGTRRTAYLTIGGVTVEYHVDTPHASCSAPWGQSVAHGTTVQAFTAATVAFGQSCATVAQDRTCTNGVLSGTAPNGTCSIQAATYAWSSGTFGACSATCGGGTQTRAVTCRRQDGATVADSFCAGVAKPATTQSCNTQACAAKTCGTGAYRTALSGGYEIDSTRSVSSQSACKTHCQAHPSIGGCIWNSTGMCFRYGGSPTVVGQHSGSWSSQTLYASTCR